MAKEFNLEVDPEIDEVFDEVSGGNSFLALRKLKWDSNSPFKLDMRKWFVHPDGSLVAGKGISFMTEQGPDNLINALIRHNYGNTETIVNNLKGREDFYPVVKKVIAEDGIDLNTIKIPEDENKEKLYDPKQIL